MTWKIFTPQQLSNPDYQKRPEISGSGLSDIYFTSPAHFKYQERDETPALRFGIASHSMVLEPEEFDKEFVRGVDEKKYPDALVTDRAMGAKLKELGQKATGLNLWEKTQAILKNEPETHILHVLDMIAQSENAGKTVLTPDDYDGCQSMRKTLMQDEQIAEMLAGGFSEYSLIGELEGVRVKNRPDLITSAGGIIQYKTTMSCRPEDIGKKVNDYGYLLKAALEWDCFTEAYGHPPKYYIMLAQEKKTPFVFKPFNIAPDSDEMRIGRIQLDHALRVYKHCLENDKWPAYGCEIAQLEVAQYIKNKYDMGQK